MSSTFIDFLLTAQDIFGVCPCCGEIFRLSDCRISASRKARRDWKQQLDDLDRQLGDMENDILAGEQEAKERAAASGRRAAQRAIAKMDSIFGPAKLHPDDAKVVCHPIDYIVFKGMNSSPNKETQSIILLDRERTDADSRRLQASIERTVERGSYDWLTLRVRADGSTVEE
ncbi:MAG: Holliday junction resolvase-like protein [Acidobacteriaceae bacterium]